MADEHTENPSRETWIELIFNVVLPAVVLIFLSGDDRLGPTWGLVLGLSFPIAHATRSRLRGDQVSPLSFLGVISVLLTGGIGLLELEASWFAVKEAVLPLVLALLCWLSRYTPWPVVDTLIFRLLDREKVDGALAANGEDGVLEPLLLRVNIWFIGCFGYSAVASYFLARYLVTSPTGTAEFNAELGTFTFVSFPVVALPMTLALGVALNGMLTALETATGKEVDDLLRPGLAPKKDPAPSA